MTEGEMLIDAKAINARIKRDEQVNLQPKRMTFAAPADTSQEVLEAGTRKNIDRWLTKLEAEGLQLKSRVAVYPNGVATALSGVPILDRKAYVATAYFKFIGKYETTRIELAPGTYKEDPDHTVPVGENHTEGLSSIVKAAGL